MEFNEYKWISNNFAKAFKNAKFLNKRVNGAYGLIAVCFGIVGTVAYEEYKYQKKLIKILKEMDTKIEKKADKVPTDICNDTDAEKSE